MRPTAKLLQQHKFCVNPDHHALQRLMPLIERTQQYMAEISATNVGISAREEPHGTWMPGAGACLHALRGLRR